MSWQLVAKNTFELIHVEIFWVSLLGLWLIYGLVAYWICSRKFNWFIRFCCLTGCAALMMGIKAPVLMLVVLFYSLTIWAAKSVCGSNGIKRLIRLLRRADSGTEAEPLQIGLADGMLATCVFAILLVVTRTELTDPFSLPYAVAFGIALGATAVLAYWLAHVNSIWVLAIGIFASIGGAFVAHRLIFPAKPGNLFLNALSGTTFVWGELHHFAIAILISNSIAIYLLTFLSNWKRRATLPSRLIARTLWCLSVIAIVGLSISTVDVYRRLLRTYEYALHVPSSNNEINGFDELMTAGKRIGESTLLSDPDAAPVGAVLAKELEMYAADFRLVESAMHRPTQTAAIESIEEFYSALDDVHNARAIARALACRAKQRFHVGEADKAMDDCCRIVELSVPLSQAKILVSELVANAIEGIGEFAALDYIESAPSATLRSSIERLAAIESKRAAPEEIYRNDFATSWEHENWVGRLFLICDEKRHRSNFETNLKDITFDRCLAQRRQVITLMALELFRRKHNGYPKSLSELVPEHLPSVPRDPYAVNQSLSYHLSDSKDTFQLYSVGPDRKDDAGKLGASGLYDEGDINMLAKVQYDKATTWEERKALEIPSPWDQELPPEEEQIIDGD